MTFMFEQESFDAIIGELRVIQAEIASEHASGRACGDLVKIQNILLEKARACVAVVDGRHITIAEMA